MANRWFGVAQIRDLDGNLFAACPITVENRAMLEEWFSNNVRDLLEEGQETSGESGYARCAKAWRGMQS
jgi:hypothetical protein